MPIDTDDVGCRTQCYQEAARLLAVRCNAQKKRAKKQKKKERKTAQQKHLPIRSDPLRPASSDPLAPRPRRSPSGHLMMHPPSLPSARRRQRRRDLHRRVQRVQFSDPRPLLRVAILPSQLSSSTPTAAAAADAVSVSISISAVVVIPSSTASAMPAAAVHLDRRRRTARLLPVLPPPPQEYKQEPCQAEHPERCANADPC